MGLLLPHVHALEVFQEGADFFRKPPGRRDYVPLLFHPLGQLRFSVPQSYSLASCGLIGLLGYTSALLVISLGTSAPFIRYSIPSSGTSHRPPLSGFLTPQMCPIIADVRRSVTSPARSFLDTGCRGTATKKGLGPASWVLSKHRVKNCIGYVVGHLVRMTHRYGLAGEKVFVRIEIRIAVICSFCHL